MLKREYGRLLSQYTSFKIGGPVFCWLEPEDLQDLLEILYVAEGLKKPVFFIGKGSNLLVNDSGFDGICVHLRKGFDVIEMEEGDIIRVGAGCPVPVLVNKTVEWGLTGCEFLAGVPGSFGGALFMNAGVRDVQNPERMLEVKDIALDIDVVDIKNRERETLRKEDIGFGYRSSGLDGKCIISGRLKLDKSDRGIIRENISHFLEKRKWMQGLGFPTAGSVFKNPICNEPVGRLIEECNLKGTRIGGAEISRAHGNFIVNVDNASAGDVIGLIELAKRRVKEKFGIDLELELKLI